MSTLPVQTTKKLVLRYEVLIGLGILVVVWSTLNVLGITNTSSDVFWALFGLGAVVEGLIELFYGEEEDAE